MGTKKTVAFSLVWTMLCLWSALDCAAMPGDVRIEIDDEGISGYGKGVRFDRLMESLSGKTGWDVYLDERLRDETVTFRFQEKTPVDQAIKRMVKPFNYAVTYKVKRDGSVSVSRIQVFQREKPEEIRYQLFTAGKDQSIGMETPARSLTGSDSGSPPSLQSGTKSLVKEKPFRIRRSLFGSPTITPARPDRAPDFRPDALQLEKTHKQVIRNTSMANQRRESSIRKAGTQASMERRAFYHRYRNRKIRQILKREDQTYE